MKNKLSCRILKLECFVPSESNTDDVYVKYNKAKIWPLQKKYLTIKNRTEALMNIEILDVTPGQVVRLELWEHDILSPDDLLGEFVFTVDKKGGPFSTDLTALDKISRYQIKWEALEMRNLVAKEITQ